MSYLDTSLVVALCTPERDSSRVEAALAAAREGFCISEWTRVEFISAIRIKFRNRELSEPLARRALSDYYAAFVPESRSSRLHATTRYWPLTLEKAFIKAACGIDEVPVELPW